MRSEEEVNRAIEQYSDMIKRICFIHLKNQSDTEDIFQTVFMKYALSSVVFKNEEHKKAWFIRVTVNACKDLLKSFFRRHTVSLDEAVQQAGIISDTYGDVYKTVLKLPEKYRKVIYLRYYEGYTAPQIGKILGKNVNTVYTTMTRARDILKKELGCDYDG